MKPPKPELQNTRVLRIALRVLSLPVALCTAILGRIKAMLERGKSPKQVRAEDQLRQSRARRELRGLSQDHVHEARKSG